MLEVELFEYSGMVYDLMVEDDESFVAEGVVVHNCSMIPLVEGFPLPQFQTGEEWFKTLSEDQQRRMMGNGRYEAWRDGLFQFRQLAGVGNHPVWGPSLRETSLMGLLQGGGGLNGQAADPVALLKAHQAMPAPERKPTTLTIGKGDKALVGKLIADLSKAGVEPATYHAMEKALSKMLAGQTGMVYLDKNGRLTGGLAYQTKQGNLQYLQVTGAGFLDAETNLKAIIHLAKLAQQKKQGIELYAPNSFFSLYQDWGFTVHQPLANGARLRLRPDDIAGFLKDPANYGQTKLEAIGQAALKALADPDATFTFRSGQPIPGLPFNPVTMSGADFAAMTKVLPFDPPLQLDDPDKHAAAGMLLFTPDGKLVVVDPAGGYGGYKTTFPKGTQEEGMSLQETAVKEVYEETGFKAKILGHLGDYEKSASVTRFYIGVVEDGAPWMAHYESEAVRIVPLDQVDALLNVGADKYIFQDLLKLQAQALEGKPFSVESLEAGLDKYAAAQGKLPPPPGEKLPEEMTKKELVAHLTKMRGIAQWKLNVASKEQVAALFALPAEEALAAIDAFGAAHTAKYAKQKGAPQPEPEPPKLPPPTEDPASLTKKALMEHLAQMRGIAQWKLSVMKKDDIVALFGMTEAEALAAIDAAGQAHTDKYAKGKKPPPEPSVVAVTGDGKPVAPEATVAGQTKAEPSDEPLITPPPPKGKAAAVKVHLAKHLSQLTGGKYTPLALIKAMNDSDLTVEELTNALVGQPISAIDALVAAPPPSAEPLDIKKWATGDAVNHFSALAGAFEIGSPAYKGVGKAEGNIDAGHSGFGYTDAEGFATGVITFHDVGGTLKVSGAAFTDLAVNKEAMADVANVALGQGLPLKTYVPNGLKAEYKKWGFKDDGSGVYMTLQPGDMPKLITAVGKKPKEPPKKKPAPAYAEDEDEGVPTSVIGMPGDVSAAAAVKLSKDALVSHLANKGNVPASKLQKYTKAQLVQFMEMDAFEAIDLMQKGAKPPPPAPPPKAPEPVPMVEKRPLPPNLPAFQMPDPPGFPADVGQMKVVKGLGGSTGAKLVEDPATGKKYVLKTGNSAGHLREEAYADAAYQALGLNVPTFKVYETPNGPVKLAEFKSGMRTLGEALAKADPAERKKIVANVRKGFAADALMGNWDVIGASKDNILVDDKGEVWRIDNGGSLRYRAQGAKKEKEFLSDYPVELWTLRDKKVGPENAQIFGELGIYEIMDQVRGIVPKAEKLLAAVPEELRPMVHGRLEVMRDLVGTSDSFKDDKWKATYTDGFLEQSTYIRRQGLIDALPQQMKQAKKGSTTVYDENGKEFDALRGQGSHVEAWAAYCKANGGDPGIIRYWMSAQAGSSWSSASQALKYRLVQERGGETNDYFWRDGVDSARKAYDNAIKVVGKEKYHKTWAMWHAWVYESLRRMEFSRKKGGVIEVVRTEGSDIMKTYGVKMGATNTLMLRGAAESGSIFRAKRIIAGGEVTRQRVPIHRVLGYYWTDRPGNQNNSGGFLGDAENEIVFIPEGIPFDYIDSISGSKGVEDYWQ